MGTDRSPEETSSPSTIVPSAQFSCFILFHFSRGPRSLLLEPIFSQCSLVRDVSR